MKIESSEDMQKYIDELIEQGYIAEDGTPLKCKCGNTDFETKNSYGDGNNIVEEMDIYCKECGNLVGHWAYGAWDM